MRRRHRGYNAGPPPGCLGQSQNWRLSLLLLLLVLVLLLVVLVLLLVVLVVLLLVVVLLMVLPALTPLLQKWVPALRVLSYSQSYHAFLLAPLYVFPLSMVELTQFCVWQVQGLVLVQVLMSVQVQMQLQV